MMEAIEAAAHTIFLNRIGDQLRFAPLPGTGSKIMSYVLDMDFLAATSPSRLRGVESIQTRLVASWMRHAAIHPMPSRHGLVHALDARSLLSRATAVSP